MTKPVFDLAVILLAVFAWLSGFAFAKMQEARREREQSGSDNAA